jgi:predicted small secreted protein
MKTRTEGLMIVAVALICAGCNTTGVLDRGIGADVAHAEATAARPLTPTMANRTIWVEPVAVYEAARQLPAAAVTTAYDAPMAVGSEAAQLLAWTWGGQDVVTEATYRTWRDVRSVEPINPIPHLAPAESVEAWDEMKPRSGWTSRGLRLAGQMYRTDGHEGQ